MAYFNNFPLVPYYFGNEKTFNYIENMGVYVDLIDQLVDDVSFYSNHVIKDGDRPDTLSYQLYGSTEYYWTFFLSNPSLRECGWPLTRQDVEEKAKVIYPNYSVQIDGTHRVKDLFTSSTVLGKRLSTGQQVIINNNTIASVVHLNLDIGKVVLKYVSSLSGNKSSMTNIDTMYFDNGLYPYHPSYIRYTYSSIYGSGFYNNVVEHNAPHHYTNNSGERIDIDPFDLSTSLAGANAVTNQEYLERQNESVKTIRIIKPNSVRKIVQEFARLVRN